MNYKCEKCGGDLPLDLTKECPTCFPATIDSTSPMQRILEIAKERNLPVDRITMTHESYEPTPPPVVVTGPNTFYIANEKAAASCLEDVAVNGEFFVPGYAARNLGEAVVAWYQNRRWPFVAPPGVFAFVTPDDAAQTPPPLAE